MILKDGEIIENSHIGVFYLGMSKKQIFSLLDLNYEKERQKNVVRIGNIAFWFNSREEVFQIGVTKGFQGKFRGVIGIGSTLEDVKKNAGNFVYAYDVYEPENISGICFELEDVDDWEELTAPIEWIYVYSLKYFHVND